MWLVDLFFPCLPLSSCCVAAHCAVCEWGRESGAGVWRRRRRGGLGVEEGRHRVTEQLTVHHSSWAATSDHEHHCGHHWIQPVIQLWKQNDCPHHQWRYYMSPYISIATVDRLVHRLVWNGHVILLANVLHCVASQSKQQWVSPCNRWTGIRHCTQWHQQPSYVNLHSNNNAWHLHVHKKEFFRSEIMYKIEPTHEGFNPL